MMNTKTKRLIDREPKEKMTPEMIKKIKFYDVIFENDISKGISNKFRFRENKGELNKIMQNAEILFDKPPADPNENEQEVYPWNAWAGSEHRWGWWIFTIYHYPAVNAISGRNYGHWESARGRTEEFWEAEFDRPKKINYIMIKYITLPEFFQIFYKIGDSNGDYIPAIDEYQTAPKINTVTNQRTDYNLVPKTYSIIFNKPIYAKRVKIIMKTPVNTNYFAINKVHFFQKRSYVLVKNELMDYCTNMCFFINTDKIRENIPIEIYPCLEILNLADNRELFVYYNDRSLRIANDQNKCVGFNGAKEVVLKTCNNYQPTYALDFKSDGTLYFHGYENECVYVEKDMNFSENFVNSGTEVIVTSEGDLQTYKKENIKINGNNYWASSPGEEKVTMQVLFGKFKNELGQTLYESKKVDVVKIQWFFAPKKFSVFTWKQGGSWVLKKSFNNVTTKETEINFSGEQFAGIMFVFEKGNKHKDLGNRVAYGILYMFIGSKSKRLKVGDCKGIDRIHKIFDFDNQDYRKIDKTKGYIDSMNKLQNTFFILRTKYLILLKDKMFINQAKIKGQHMRELLISTLKKLREEFLEKIKEFRFVEMTKIKNTEFLNIITEKKYKPILFPDLSATKQIGTYDFPGEDCLSIKKAKKSSISGWYFIKPECSSKPIRVFCDFSIVNDAVDIFVFNDDNDVINPNINYLKIRTPDDIRFNCAKLGLYPIRITNYKMIKRISQILKLLNYDLNMPQAIPLGYDYSCDMNNSCSGFYKSLNDRSSGAINSYFKKSTSAKLEAKGKFVGLGFADRPEFQTYNLDSKIRIGALICSTNHFKTDITDNMIKKISCTTSVAGNGDMFPPGNDILVSCPMDCDLFPGIVRGVGFYHSSSSICRAAIHSGVIGKAGGKIHLRVSPPQAEYKASQNNGISSIEFKDDNLSSFVLEKYVANCPINAYKNDPNYADSSNDEENHTSFLETGSKVELNKQEIVPPADFSFLEENEEENQFPKMPDLKKLAGDALNKGKELFNNGMVGLSKTVNDAVKDSENIKNNAMDFIKNAKDKALDTYNSVKDKLGNVLNRSNPEGQQDLIDPTVKPKNELNKDSNKCEPNTVIGQQILKSRREEHDWNYFEKIKKKRTAVIAEIESFNKSLSWSKNSSPISNNKILKLFNFVERFRNKLLKLIKNAISAANGRIFRTKIILNKLEDHYFKIIERKDYKLNYNNKDTLFKNEWKVYDFVNNQKQSSKWDIFTADINNRERAIGTNNKILNNKFPGASFIVLNRKRYYDFELNLDILFKSTGIAGIAFRYRNPFNYYALVINRKRGYKEIIKVVNGDRNRIQIINDGGILINSWHSVIISSQANKFHIFINDSSNQENSRRVIEFYDTELSSGTVALFTNNIDAFYFDKFEIKAKPCWSPWLPKDDISIISNTANVFTENFKGKFIENYDIVDPPESRKGPSSWSMITKPKENEELGILQDSLIYDTSSLRLSSLVLLKDKYLRNGIVRVEFIPQNDNGIVSIVFKYFKIKTETESFESYYSFDMINTGDMKKNQFILRKIHNGLSKELKSINSASDVEGHPRNLVLGYRPFVPHYVEISVNNMRISISISVNSRPFITIINIDDDSLKLGQVGFGTFAVKSIFTTFEIRPPKYELTQEKLQFFLKNGKDQIAMNPYITDNEGAEGQDNSGNGSDTSNSIKPNYRNKNDPVWKNCVVNKTTEQRKLYCEQTFANKFKRDMCKRNFCDTCCKSNVFFMHTNTSHQCMKACNKSTIGEKGIDYNDVCFNSSNPDKNIYSYCQNKFVDEPLMKTCKYDMCNLCCVNLNTLQNKKFDYTTIRSCFKSCSKRFHPFN